MKWQKLLKILKLQHIEKKAPGFFKESGGYTMQVRPYKDNTSNELSRCIIDFITHLGGYSNRVNTMGTVRKINGVVKWTKGNGNLGAPDIRFIYQGKSGDIEIKIGTDRMSPAQLKEMDRITAAGGLAFVATDFPSFLEWWQSVGFTIPELENSKQLN